MRALIFACRDLVKEFTFGKSPQWAFQIEGQLLREGVGGGFSFNGDGDGDGEGQASSKHSASIEQASKSFVFAFSHLFLAPRRAISLFWAEFNACALLAPPLLCACFMLAE